MKVLYAIQGTGNGHLSRAKEVIPRLKDFCEFDLLISGGQYQVIPGFKPKFEVNGLTLIYSHSGAVDLKATYRKNSLKGFFREVKALPVEEYDLVINDFEPVSAWACKLRGVPCIALSHQASFMSSGVPKVGTILHPSRLLMRYFAPAGLHFGFHFKEYGDRIYSPLIRTAIRELKPEDHGHVLAYLPAYSPAYLARRFRSLSSQRFEIFSKGISSPRKIGHITIYPIGHDRFEESLRTCTGVICSAGFELPSESLFLGKKLLVVPIRNQYEQACNAKALRELGVPVLTQLKTEQLRQWLRYGELLQLDLPDHIEQVLRNLFEEATRIQTRKGKPAFDLWTDLRNPNTAGLPSDASSKSAQPSLNQV